MKCYVFLTASIVDVGGAQLYTAAKMNYLKENGWQVFIYSYLDGEIMISGFEEYKNSIIKELSLLPTYYSRRKVYAIVSRIGEKHANYDTVVVETHNVALHIWGELLSESIKAKHLIYEINELPHCPKQFFDYFKFKFDRKEMFGITPSSLNIFFNGLMDVPVSDELCLVASYNNNSPVEDIYYDTSDIPKSSPMCCIGLVGRLDKPYMLEASKRLALIISRDREKNYTIVIVGGEKENENFSVTIKKEFNHIDNAHIVMTGYLYPIPRKLIQLFDICIAGSGTATIVAKEGVPTIAMDSFDLFPIGVIGFTTESTIFRESEERRMLEETISEIQHFPFKFRRDNNTIPSSHDAINSPYDNHIQAVSLSGDDLKYYKNFCFNLNMGRIILSVFGRKVFDKISNIKRRVQNFCCRNTVIYSV